MTLTLLETFLCDWTEEIIFGIASNCFFPPRVNEVSREKVEDSAARKIRQNERGTPLDNRDGDNIFESGHIINIDDRLSCVWFIQREIVETWLEGKLWLSDVQGSLADSKNNLSIYSD